MALAKELGESVRVLETDYTEAELLDLWHAHLLNSGIEIRTKGKQLEDLGWTAEDLRKVKKVRNGR